MTCTMKQKLRLTVCVLLVALCVMQPVFAAQTDSGTPLTYQPSTSGILCAAEPLIEAQAEYYNIHDISVENVETKVDSSGVIDTVNRAYAAHTNDRRYTYYNENYWLSGETEEYYVVMLNSNISIMSTGGSAER